MSAWIGVVIAGLALALSAITWFWQVRRQELSARRADVTVFLHWLSEHARVEVPGHGSLAAGYHIVLSNRGPAAAHSVSLEVRNSRGEILHLLDLERNELPLSVLDADGKYPIPWLYEPFTRHARRFEARLAWTDGGGTHQRTVPLRRGQLPS